MLEILQSLSLIAAFFLPWMIGLSVSFYKKGKRDKFLITLISSVVCTAVIALALFIAFSASAV
ncbi:MAG: hypothetical protein E7672_03570 [Ruminococcaceae bacterium]|nr:hypothetical protein [Oscillospiraceae bacterium]